MATVMNELDKGIWGRWKEVGLGKERKRGVERDVKEFWGRMEEVRREAEGEKEDREERGVIKTPEGLNDYLFASEDDILVRFSLSRFDFGTLIAGVLECGGDVAGKICDRKSFYGSDETYVGDEEFCGS